MLDIKYDLSDQCRRKISISVFDVVRLTVQIEKIYISYIQFIRIAYYNRLWDCPEGGSSNPGPGSGVHFGS